MLTHMSPHCADPIARVHRTATFLPEVSANEGWGQMQTLEALIRKAGYNGNARTIIQNLEVRLLHLFADSYA